MSMTSCDYRIVERERERESNDDSVCEVGD